MNKNNDAPLKKVFSQENSYLSKEDADDETDYKMLSQISKVDISVFSSNKMNELIKELKNIKYTLSIDERRHIDDILELAKLCMFDSNLILGVTPFSTFLTDQELKTLNKTKK